MCGMSFVPFLSEVGAVCGSSARTDLRGGCRVTGIPTAIVGINTVLFLEESSGISGVEQPVFIDRYGTGTRCFSSSNQFRSELYNCLILSGFAGRQRSPSHDDIPSGGQVTITRIYSIQGVGLRSPLAGKDIETEGVVIGTGSKGFFIQDAKGDDNASTSDAIFVYSPSSKPPVWALVIVSGKVVDFQHDPDGNERPTTQIIGRSTKVIAREGPRIEPVWLTANSVPNSPWLKSLGQSAKKGPEPTIS